MSRREILERAQAIYRYARPLGIGAYVDTSDDFGELVVDDMHFAVYNDGKRLTVERDGWAIQVNWEVA